MYSVFIFGGTTEARILATTLVEQKIKCTITVTTDYAKDLLPESHLLDVIVKRLTVKDMENIIKTVNPSLIIDSTHPYAVEVSGNIKKACSNLKREYITVVRDLFSVDNSIDFDSIEKLSLYLNRVCKPNEVVFSTLGIKEAATLCKNFIHFKSSLYLRILPSMESLKAAIDLGFPSKHIICMQGPFSKTMNSALFKETGARYLLTKQSGTVGGLESKISASIECGIEVLTLKAPDREKGLSLEDAISLIMRDKWKEKKNER